MGPRRLILDDRALVVHLKGRGLVVLTGCGHAGVVNIVRHAERLTDVPTLNAAMIDAWVAGSSDCSHHLPAG